MKLIRSQHTPWVVYAACSLLSLALLTSNLQGGLIARQFEAVVLDFMNPVYSSVNWSVEKVTGYWSSYINLIDLRTENSLLKKELNQTREKLLTLNEKALAASRLEALFANEMSDDFPVLYTRVIRRSNSVLNATVLINAGTDDGLREGHGVSTIHGAIGQVVSAGPHIAKVITLHHPDAGIGAILEKSRIQGVVSGTGKGTCIMRFVSRFDPVVLGETVLTSGLDNAFPKGIPIGKVTNIIRDPGEIFQSIEIIPLTDLNSIEELLVYLMPEFTYPEITPTPVTESVDGSAEEAEAAPGEQQ